MGNRTSTCLITIATMINLFIVLLNFEDSKETCSLFSVFVIKNVHQRNIPFMKTIHIMYQT